MLSARAAVAIQTDLPHSSPRSSEQDLFVQVVMLALIDCASRNTTHRRLASVWIFSPFEEADFTHVCALAGLEPDFVRRLAQKALAHDGPIQRQGPRGSRRVVAA